MLLYELKRGASFRLVNPEDVITPPCSVDTPDEVYTFSHIDGMYSYCTTENGVVHHFAATTEIKEL